MKTIEEFFKNRLVNKISEYTNDDNISNPDIFKSFYYISEVKNPQKLNIKNTFDLLEYLTPLFTYIASNIKVFKEDFIKNHANNCVNYQGYAFMFKITLTADIMFYPICYVGMQYGYIHKKDFLLMLF